MSNTILHYIYDPLCGWCYGATSLVHAAREVMPVRAHGGGMMTGSRRQQVSPQLRDYVIAHDRKIAQLTGQSFGDAYFEGLLRGPLTCYGIAVVSKELIPTNVWQFNFSRFFSSSLATLVSKPHGTTSGQ